MGVPFALDFGAIFTVAAAQGADQEFLAEVLPAVEAAILDMLAGDDAGGDDDHSE